MALNLSAVKANDKGVARLKTDEVEVPEWGGKVLLRELTGLAMDRFQGKAIDPETQRVDMALLMERRARIVQASIVDPDTGRLMFDSEKDFKQYIGALSAPSLEALAASAMKLNGLDEGKDETES